MTSVPEKALSFEQMLTNLENSLDWQRLPDIRLAMSPLQVGFSDDLSDATLFNDRFVESRVFVGKMAFALHLVCGAFCVTSLAVTIAVAYEIIDGRSLSEILSLNWVLALFSLLMFASAYFFSKLEPVYVRFNRQAQLVHIYRGPNKATSIPWREVHPFTQFSPSGDGKFSLKLIFRTGSADLDVAPGALDICDESALVDNLLRLEFLRRYMAEGLSAVQPAPGLTVRKPNGFTVAADWNDGALDFLLEKLVLKPFYYLAGGPLIDRYLLRRAANIHWPEEVERLCASGANLTGYDTTPVQASKNVFYRFNGYGFDLVNINGDVIG